MTQIIIDGQADFKKALKQIDDFSKQSQKNFDRVKLAAGAVGAALAGIGSALAIGKIGKEVVALVNDFSKAGDNIAKTADKIGVGIEALQELRFAAERTGVSQQALDQSLQNLTKRIGEAAAGVEKPKQAFQKLGISIRDAGGNIKPTEEIFNEFADRLKDIPNQSDRVAIAFKLFGNEGVSLVNTLKDGSAGLNQLRQEFKNLGGVISTDAARASEVYQDNLTDLNVAFSSIGKTIAQNFLPLFNQIVVVAKNFIVQNKGIVEDGIKPLIQGFASLSQTALPLTIKAITSLTNLFLIFIQAQLKLNQGLNDLLNSFFKFKIVQDIFDSIISGVSILAGGVIGSIEIINDAFTSLLGPIQKLLGIDVNSFKIFLNDLKNDLFGIATQKNTDAFSKKLDGVSKSLDGSFKKTNDFRKSVNNLGDTVSDATKKALDPTNLSLKSVANSSKSTGEEFKKASRSIAGFSSELQDVKISDLRSKLNSLRTTLEKTSLSAVELARKNFTDSQKIIDQGLKLAIISRKEAAEITVNIEKQLNLDLKKAAEEQEKIERIKTDNLRNALETRRKITESIASSGLGIFNQAKINEELQKIAPQLRVEIELELKKSEGISAVTGLLNSISQGAKGAIEILKSGVEALGDALLPGLGKPLAQLAEFLAQSSEQVQKSVSEFFQALPELVNNIIKNIGVFLKAILENLGPFIQNLFNALIDGLLDLIETLFDLPDILIKFIENIDVFFERIVEKSGEFIEKLVEKAPLFIEKLVEALPQIILFFNQQLPLLINLLAIELIQQAPFIVFSFVEAFIKSIPKIVQSFIDGIGKALTRSLDIFGKIGKVFGFNQGGLVQGVGTRDTVPAMLTAGEFVLTKDLASKLESFLSKPDEKRSTQNQNINITLSVGEQELSRVLLNLTEKGFRIA